MICHSYPEKGALYSFLSNLTNKSVWRLKICSHSFIKKHNLYGFFTSICVINFVLMDLAAAMIWPETRSWHLLYISRFLSSLLEISSSNYLVSNVVKIHKYMINLKSKNDTAILVGLSSEKNSCDRLNRYQISCSIKIWGSHSAEHGLPGRKQQWI